MSFIFSPFIFIFKLTTRLGFFAVIGYFAIDYYRKDESERKDIFSQEHLKKSIELGEEYLLVPAASNMCKLSCNYAEGKIKQLDKDLN